MNELVSIIIPAYNRGDLIEETLKSIANQTYKNWECITVDDRSNDNTVEVINNCTHADSRFKTFIRPVFFPGGANSCRNYGYEKSSGEYIIWFDSDDLMTPDHIESKLNLIKEKELGFVVARTQNFRGNEFLEPYIYKKNKYGIKASDFILLKIHWYTYDVMLKRELTEKITWNEKMKSWQDYNYFCKMLLITENGDYLDKVLTYRRIHSNSIQKTLNQDSKTFNKELLENRILTYNDISRGIDLYTRKELVFGMMNICFELSKIREKSNYIKQVEKIVNKQLGLKSKLYFKIALSFGGLFEKGHYLLNKAKQR